MWSLILDVYGAVVVIAAVRRIFVIIGTNFFYFAQIVVQIAGGLIVFIWSLGLDVRRGCVDAVVIWGMRIA